VENIPGFFSCFHFNGNQTVQGPKDSLTANCSKGFKRSQMMNKGLIKRNDRSFKKTTTTVSL